MVLECGISCVSSLISSPEPNGQVRYLYANAPSSVVRTQFQINKYLISDGLS